MVSKKKKKKLVGKAAQKGMSAGGTLSSLNSIEEEASKKQAVGQDDAPKGMSALLAGLHKGKVHPAPQPAAGGAAEDGEVAERRTRIEAERKLVRHGALSMPMSSGILPKSSAHISRAMCISKAPEKIHAARRTVFGKSKAGPVDPPWMKVGPCPLLFAALCRRTMSGTSSTCSRNKGAT